MSTERATNRFPAYEADDERCAIICLNERDVVFWDATAPERECWLACQDAPVLAEWR